MLKSTRFNVAYLMIAILGVFMLHEAWTASKAVSAIPYNEFQQLLRESKVKEVVISTDSIQGELKAEHNGRSRFVTTRVDADPSLSSPYAPRPPPPLTGHSLAHISCPPLDRHVEQRTEIDGAAASEARKPARREREQRLELRRRLLPALAMPACEPRLAGRPLRVFLLARLALDRVRRLRGRRLRAMRARDDLGVVRTQLVDEVALAIGPHGLAA